MSLSLGKYSEALTLSKFSARTREGRFLKAVRNEFAKHLGGWDALSPPQRDLVDRAAMLKLRIMLMDRKMVNSGFEAFDTNVYLAWSNSLVRCLRELGLKPTETEPTDPLDRLHQHLASKHEAAT